VVGRGGCGLGYGAGDLGEWGVCYVLIDGLGEGEKGGGFGFGFGMMGEERR